MASSLKFSPKLMPFLLVGIILATSIGGLSVLVLSSPIEEENPPPNNPPPPIINTNGTYYFGVGTWFQYYIVESTFESYDLVEGDVVKIEVTAINRSGIFSGEFFEYNPMDSLNVSIYINDLLVANETTKYSFYSILLLPLPTDVDWLDAYSAFLTMQAELHGFNETLAYDEWYIVHRYSDGYGNYISSAYSRNYGVLTNTFATTTAGEIFHALLMRYVIIG